MQCMVMGLKSNKLEISYIILITLILICGIWASVKIGLEWKTRVKDNLE